MRALSDGSYVLSLKSVSRRDIGLVGAKAANLGEMAGAGFPVPEAFALTTGAFDRFVQANGLDSGSTLAELAAAVIPEEVAAGLLEGVADLVDVPLAVRSSGVAEDMPGASFAGQYETVLPVRGAEALLQAVEKCWSSAFSERVRVYRNAQDEQSPPAMAVLIQRLVDADAAGVAFTANPVTGDRNETVVSAVRGLGERLVSGQATPDEWVIRDHEASCRHAPEKAINAAQAREIADLARRAEAYFGSPQDIEWAIAGEKLYLLQARPVTTLAKEKIEPLPIAVEVPEGFWQREATHAPKPWTPMAASLLYPLRNSALKRAFAEFGLLLETLELRRIGGWEYARQVPLGGKDRPAPPSWLFWLVTRLVPQMRARIRQSVEAVRSEKAVRIFRRWHEEWRPALEGRIAELGDVDLISLTDDQLDEHLGKTIALFEEGNNIHFLVHTALGTLGSIVFVCRDLLGWDEAKTFDMLNGLSQKSTEPSRWLAELAGIVREDPSLTQTVDEIGLDSLHQLLQADPDFGRAFRDYMRKYGCRALRYELGDPNLAESPELVLGLIRDQIVRAYDPATDSSLLKAKRSSTVEEARASLARRSSQERERFEHALAHAELAYPVREDNEFYTCSAPLGLIRFAALEMGRRLAGRGQIGERDDVFFLEMDEARRALRVGGDQVALITRRKGENAWVLAHPGPLTYGEDPGPPPDFGVLPVETRFLMEAALWYMDRIFAQEQTRQGEDAGEGLRGIPASAGEYQGTVRVIMDESQFGKLRAGDVLVCPITSPVWSVLFPSIGALVTDTGGILSHPAIIAREYRVPAVVAVGRATRELHDGQTVLVDGSKGTVQVIS